MENLNNPNSNNFAREGRETSMNKPRNAEEEDKESLFSDNSSNKYRSRSRSRDYVEKGDHRSKREEMEFIIKNGCCRECMRAFSKTGKSCLCQVPKFERKYTLPDKGCNFCGCKGCNPVDVRKETRKDRKRELKDDKNIMYKKQRLLDSDDEDLKISQNDVDDWNKKRKEVLSLLSQNLKSSPYLFGFGVPLRTPSYILGYQPSKPEAEMKSRRHDDNRRRSERKRSEDYSYEK